MTKQTQVHRKWSVLDCRHKTAEVYELAVIVNETGAFSFVRFVLRDKKIIHAINIVPFGKMTNEKTEAFAQAHVTYLEMNFCFCSEVADGQK